MQVSDGASFKIERATQHIRALDRFLSESRPFSYVVETDRSSGERATFAKRKPKLAAEAASIGADAVHNLRSALDHAYWAIVSPLVTVEKERKRIQFPFSESASGLADAIATRLAQRVSKHFVDELIRLKPHGGAGGNELLYLLHEIDLIDKHKFLPPVGDYTRLTGAVVRRQVPDFPAGINGCMFSNNRRDVSWTVPIRLLKKLELGEIVPPTTSIFHREIDVPVGVVVAVGPDRELRPLVATLNELVTVTMNSIDVIQAAARAG